MISLVKSKMQILVNFRYACALFNFALGTPYRHTKMVPETEVDKRSSLFEIIY